MRHGSDPYEQRSEKDDDAATYAIPFVADPTAQGTQGIFDRLPLA